MRASEVMLGSFATVKPSTPLIDAVRLLLETNQRGLPVVDDNGDLVGIISEGDLLHRDELDVKPHAGNWLEQIIGIEEKSPARERMRSLSVGVIMTPEPVCVDEDATVDDVVNIMDSREVGQIPVVSAGKVIGIINRFQLISVLERSLSGVGSKRRPAARTS
jgi:CBS domain-containing protein